MTGRVSSVNLGVPAEYPWLGYTVRTAIFKAPAAGPVAVRGVNLEGDDQADRTVHGGPDKAVGGRHLPRPHHGISVGEVARANHHDRRLASRLLDAPGLPPNWRRWAEHTAGRMPAK